MRGFTDSTNPVYIDLDPVVNTKLGNTTNTPYQIDGSQAEANDYGIMCNVGGTRYFIPWAKVYLIRQVQPTETAAPPPVVIPVTVK